MSRCVHGRALNGAYCEACARDFLSTAAYREEVARRATSQGPHGRSFVVEIITDPSDPRGLDAKPVRRAA